MAIFSNFKNPHALQKNQVCAKPPFLNKEIWGFSRKIVEI